MAAWSSTGSAAGIGASQRAKPSATAVGDALRRDVLEELVAAARAQSGDARNVVLTRATAKNPPKARNTLLMPVLYTDDRLIASHRIANCDQVRPTAAHVLGGNVRTREPVTKCRHLSRPPRRSRPPK